jgi:predicted metal-dependent phosphotriesterase family hydrolase
MRRHIEFDSPRRELNPRSATARSGSPGCWSSRRRGFGGQVLLSQDVCHDSQLTRYAGNGYVHLHESFLPRLRALGVSDADIDRLTIDNPRRVLAVP